MTDMLKGGKNSCFLGSFVPTSAMKQSLAERCDAFTRSSILAYFKPAWPSNLKTDALGYAITGIILQQQDKV
jgi:hypothetical protein